MTVSPMSGDCAFAVKANAVANKEKEINFLIAW